MGPVGLEHPVGTVSLSCQFRRILEGIDGLIAQQEFPSIAAVLLHEHCWHFPLETWRKPSAAPRPAEFLFGATVRQGEGIVTASDFRLRFSSIGTHGAHVRVKLPLQKLPQAPP